MSSRPADLDVCGIGSALVDVLVDAPFDVIDRAGVRKGSMQLMDREAAEVVHGLVPGGSERSGGSVANTIAGLASLGSDSAFIGRVGGDRLGSVFVDDLKALGVRFGAGRPAAGDTGRCLVLVTPDADRTMCTTLGVAAALGPEDLDLDLIARSQVTYLEGYLWDEPLAKEAFRAAIDAAHGAGRRAAMTMSDPWCVDRHRAELVGLVADDLDILLGNESELCSLMEVDDLAEACRRVRRSGLIVTVTRGAAGAWTFDGDGPVVDVPIVNVPPVEGGLAAMPSVVDTTGAGDLYAAGFLWGLTRRRGLQVCVRLGNLAAREAISHVGARPQADLAALVTAAGLA